MLCKLSAAVRAALLAALLASSVAAPLSARQECGLCGGPESDIAILAAAVPVVMATAVAWSRVVGGFHSTRPERIVAPVGVIAITTLGTITAGYLVRDADRERFEGALIGAGVGVLGGGLVGALLGGTDARLAGTIVGIGAGLLAGGA